MSSFIKAHWDARARARRQDPAASWEDVRCIDLEVATIAAALPRGSRLLDVGCANGHATFRIAHASGASEVTGVDFSEEMIAAAQSRLPTERPQSPFRFEVADARALPFADAAFDAVYTTRMLINLPNWEEQARAIGELFRICRAGGRIILSEAFWEPLCRLNALRAVAGLHPLAEPDFNRYLRMPRLADLLAARGVDFHVVEFSGLYYLGTRFLRELIADADFDGFDTPLHGCFSDLEEAHDAPGFGIQQAVVIDLPQTGAH